VAKMSIKRGFSSSFQSFFSKYKKKSAVMFSPFSRTESAMRQKIYLFNIKDEYGKHQCRGFGLHVGKKYVYNW
jgi:hypothetical protein